MKVYKFRNCLLNTYERRVVKDGVFLDLTTRTFDVLQLLVEKAGEIVTKDELLGKVWNGGFVEEGNLPVHISKLRRSLGETKGERFIETVQGTGYRFVSPVATVGENEWLTKMSGNGHGNIHIHALLGPRSIVVLPFTNDTDDPKLDYLADGLTEGLIGNLSQITDLKVIARTTAFRYKNKNVDPADVGETLGVSSVLTGRIGAPDEHLTVGVELMNVDDKRQLWGTQYDRHSSDVIKIQEEIVSAVSKNLGSGNGGVLVNGHGSISTQNPESYKYYLKGKYLADKRTADDLYKAIKCFRKSIALDPTNVHSYVEAVECFLLLFYFDYISRRELVSQIAPLVAAVSGSKCDVVHAMVGAIKMFLEWRFCEAEGHLLAAISVNPNCLRARFLYSQFLVTFGRFSDALRELDQILKIDPLSVLTYKKIANVLYRTGYLEESLDYLQEALELNPADYEALVLLGASLAEMGRYDEALDAFRTSLKHQHNVETIAMIAYTHAKAGRRSEATEIAYQIEDNESDIGEIETKLVRIYSALGEVEKSFYHLERAFSKTEIDLTALISDPRLMPISREPRFLDLVRRMGLPLAEGVF